MENRGDTITVNRRELRENEIWVEDALKLAKSSCRYCYGRGYTGYDIINNVKPICRCVANKLHGKLIVE